MKNLCNCNKCRDRRKNGKFITWDNECEFDASTLIFASPQNAFERAYNFLLKNGVRIDLKIADEGFCRTHDRLLDMEQPNYNLKPQKMKQGLFNFYGTEEIVGFDRDKAYVSFCRPESREKEVDDRKRYW